MASAGELVDCYYPATGEITCKFGSTTETEFNDAISKAKTAQSEWATWSPMDRGDVLRKCAELLERNREEIAYTEVMDIAKVSEPVSLRKLVYCSALTTFQCELIKKSFLDN